MDEVKSLVNRIKICLVAGLLMSLTGCAGFVSGGYYVDEVVVPGPDVYLFQGEYDRGQDVHNYSHRGSESRIAAHPNVRQGGSVTRVAAHPNVGQSGPASRVTAHPGVSKEEKR